MSKDFVNEQLLEYNIGYFNSPPEIFTNAVLIQNHKY